MNPNIFIVDNEPCTGDETITITTEAELIAAPGKIAAALGPLNRVSVKFNGSGFGLTNGSGWESSITQIASYVDNQQVTFLPGGKVWAATDSTNIDASGALVALKWLNGKGILQANSYGGNSFFWKTNVTSSDVGDMTSTNNIYRTGELTSSASTSISNPVPRKYTVNTVSAINAAGFKALKNAGWTRDIILNVMANGAYLNGVDDDILDMLDVPAGPALATVSYKIISATNVQLANYFPAYTANYIGLNNTTYEFDGGNYSGNKLYSSWLKACAAAGITVYPQRSSTSTNVQSTFYTNNPDHIEDSTGRIYMDWTDLLSFTSSSGGRFLLSNVIIYTSNMTVWMDYVDCVTSGRPLSTFFDVYNIGVTNVEMRHYTNYLPLPGGKQVFQPADPNSMQNSAVRNVSKARSPVVKVKKYNNSPNIQ